MIAVVEDAEGNGKGMRGGKDGKGCVGNMKCECIGWVWACSNEDAGYNVM